MTLAIDIQPHFAKFVGDPSQDILAATADTIAGLVHQHAAQARRLGSLTLGELIPFSTATQRAGLYVVFHEGRPVYVGSCRSHPFPVRLAAHLAAEPGDYLNSLAKARHHVAPAGPDLAASATAVADECAVLLLTVNQPLEPTAQQRGRFVAALLQLEHQLQRLLQCTWNNPRKHTKHIPVALRVAMDDDAESARVEHETLAALADGDDDVAWQAAVLNRLGVTEGIGLVVKVNRAWHAEDSGERRQTAILGDWACSRLLADQVRVVIGVANATIVEAWAVNGWEPAGEDRVRFRPSGQAPLDTSDIALAEPVLRARSHRYLRPDA